VIEGRAKLSDSGCSDALTDNSGVDGLGSGFRLCGHEKPTLSEAQNTFFGVLGVNAPDGPLHIPPGLSNGKVGKQCEGLDPRTIPLDVLTAAGHGPRRTASVVALFNKVMGGEVSAPEFERIKRHKHIRAYCLTCLDGNAAEVRRCTTFWCPFWPYRMRCNPHYPQRGKSPFANEAA
jgi:hypothetical protein